MKRLASLFLTSFLLQFLTAQILTPEEAVRLALENNYDIRLSRADADIAKLNNIKANAGMLPTVNFVAGDNIGVNGVQVQNFADGRTIEAYGALNNSLTALSLIHI